MEQAGCTMTTPDWPSLWERDERLRPDTMDIVLANVGALDERGEMMAPLCRDAAVRWLVPLAKPGDLRLVAPRVYDTDQWAIEMPDSDTPTEGTVFFGATLDEALFNTCKAVLGARG